MLTVGQHIFIFLLQLFFCLFGHFVIIIIIIISSSSSSSNNNNSIFIFVYLFSYLFFTMMLLLLFTTNFAVMTPEISLPKMTNDGLSYLIMFPCLQFKVILDCYQMGCFSA